MRNYLTERDRSCLLSNDGPDCAMNVIVLFSQSQWRGESRVMLHNSSNPPLNIADDKLPPKINLSICHASQTRPGQQRKVLLFSIWLRETPTKAAVLSSVAGWDCWHSSIPVSIVSQLEIIYCYQTHRALHYLQWHLGNYFTPIVWLIWLSVRDDLSCLFTDSGLRAYNSLPSIAQLQFGIITNMKSLMLFELK